jgi:RNA polymerase-binding transcription factor DksA
MTQKQLTRFRNELLALLDRVRSDAQSVEEKALTASGGQTDGGLSNVPMHLADMGTDTFMQEMNETLLENERYVVSEISAALRRIEEGSFGICENCETQIPDARIEAMPYTRHCVACAEKIRPEPELNLKSPSSQLGGSSPRQDVHAAGTAGGGTALGGLAGTNEGRGDPATGNIERATGSGEFDHADTKDAEPLAGSSGGAAGGSPAGKRSGSKPRQVKGMHRTDRAAPARRQKQPKE